jgi:hypothetical protein
MNINKNFGRGVLGEQQPTHHKCVHDYLGGIVDTCEPIQTPFLIPIT